MWYWQLLSGVCGVVEYEEYCGTIEECFRHIGDNTWRLYADSGFACISLVGSSHSFMFPVVKRNV